MDALAALVRKFEDEAEKLVVTNKDNVNPFQLQCLFDNCASNLWWWRRRVRLDNNVTIAQMERWLRDWLLAKYPLFTICAFDVSFGDFVQNVEHVSFTLEVNLKKDFLCLVLKFDTLVGAGGVFNVDIDGWILCNHCDVHQEVTFSSGLRREGDCGCVDPLNGFDDDGNCSIKGTIDTYTDSSISYCDFTPKKVNGDFVPYRPFGNSAMDGPELHLMTGIAEFCGSCALLYQRYTKFPIVKTQRAVLAFMWCYYSRENWLLSLNDKNVIAIIARYVWASRFEPDTWWQK